jgi:ABC-type polysaccharide/polyol phosphate export permease
MFEQRRYRTKAASAVGLLELIYVTTVRNLRKTHSSAVMGLVINLAQTCAMVLVLFVLMSLIGLRSSPIRGDFLLFIMSGVFLFITHNKAVGSVYGSDGPVSGMMMHAPMNTIVAMAGGALACLYQQVLTVLVILFVYHAAVQPITIDDPVGALGMLLLAWGSGVAVGILLAAAKPWWPRGVAIIKMIYQRLNMIASGKLFVANAMPGFVLQWFTWNPLFHTIDQARGFLFLNYNPHYSSVVYPVYLSAALIMIGLLVEFFTRKHASLSWRTLGV